MNGSQNDEDVLLTLLLKPSPEQWGRIDRSRLDWKRIFEIAQKNLVFLRAYRQARELDSAVASAGHYQKLAHDEEIRISSAERLMEKIDARCRREKLSYVFPKAFQHYPDMGHDVDLLVLSRSDEVDRLLGDELGLVKMDEGFFNRFSGKTTYQPPNCPMPLEIHHGRMGQMGEYDVYPRLVVENKILCPCREAHVYIPCFEDQLIIQVIQRIYAHFKIRISDLVHTVHVLARSDLNWGYIEETTKRMGVFKGLLCYLGYADQVHMRLLGQAIIPECLKKDLRQGAWGTLRFRQGYHRFPILPVALRVFSAKLKTDFISRNWNSVLRLCLLPFLLVVWFFRRVFLRLTKNIFKAAKCP